MKIGKIDYKMFSRFLFDRLGKKDKTVLVPPMPGVDSGVVDVGRGKVLIIAEDPIFTMPMLPLRTFGWFTVHIGASDVAVMGVKPRYMTYSLLMPPETSTRALKTIVDSIHKTAESLDIAIVGGHTGFYPGISAPLIAFTKKGNYVTPAGARPGNAIILTKGPAIETAGLLSVLREKELARIYPKSLIRKAKGLCRKITVVEDALVAMKAGGVTAMHDATEGGVIGGLFEIANASGVGMEVYENLMIYPAEVRMVCESFAIDPVAAIAEGSLLITARAAFVPKIIRRLERARIPASVIGTVTKDPRKRTMRRRDGSVVPLAIPDQDPFWPAFFNGLSL
jgi:hydrogenase expression/formation protein HypE